MKKFAKVLAGVMGTAMLLTACGGSPASTSTPASNPASGSSVSESSAEKSLSGELTFWSMWNDTEPQGEAFQQIVDAFEAKYPGTTINVQWAGRDISKTLKPALEGGEQIDIFDYPLQYGDQLQDYCLDLNTIKDTPFDSLDGKTLSEVLLPSMFEGPKTQLKVDKQVAVGYKPYMVLFMYNAAAFEEAGITANPTTWEELDAACAALKEAGYSPLTFDDAYAHWLPGMYLAREKGQDWVKELVADTTGEMWNDEAVVKMAEAFEDFAAKGYFDANVGGNKWPAGQMDVGNGKAAMYLNLTGLPTEVQDVTGPDFTWGAFNFPDVVEGANKQNTEGVVGSGMISINSKCENMDLAQEFLAFLYNTESDAIMVDVGGMTTSRVDGKWPAALENVKPAFDGVTTILDVGGGIEANSDLKPIISENFIKLAAGQISAEQFCSNLAAAAQQ